MTGPVQTPVAVSAPPAPGRPPRRRGQAWLRWTVLAVSGVFFLLPLLAMLEFSTRGVSGYGLQSWRGIAQDPDLVTAIRISLELAAFTALLMLVLLVPTLTWVQLRLPRLRRLIEFLCLLPLTIPAVVLVVGIAPIYAWVTYLLGDDPRTLTFAYVVLVLPYAYRAIDTGLGAIDLRTLAEAARSLGAPWRTVLWRIVVPNIRSAVVSAAFLSVALVLGEFTIASLLNFENLQVRINLIGKRDAGLSVAVALAALVFAFGLLFALSYVGRRRSGRAARDQ